MHQLTAAPAAPVVPAQPYRMEHPRPVESWALLISAIVEDPGQLAGLRADLHAGLAVHGVDPETADELVLVLSELAGNGLRHGHPPLHLVVTLRGDRTRIQVTDGGRRPAELTDVDPLDEGGRGFGIVAALSDDWGLEHLPGRGTVAWAERPVRRRG